MLGGNLVSRGKKSRGVVRVVWVTLMVIVTTVLLIAACLGVLYWGMLHMNDKSDAQIHQVETVSVTSLKHTFADISTLRFQQTTYNATTRAYTLLVVMGNSSGGDATFDFTYWPSNPEHISSYGVVDESVQQEGTTTNSVHVTYSDGTKGEV